MPFLPSQINCYKNAELSRLREFSVFFNLSVVLEILSLIMTVYLFLFFLRDVTTGLVWALKITTDPFHDILLYWRSPLALLRGELIDPMDHALEHTPTTH